MGQNREARHNLTHLQAMDFFYQGSKNMYWVKRVFSTNGAEKIGQHHAEK